MAGGLWVMRFRLDLRLRRAAAAGAPPIEAFGRASDRSWFRANTSGYRNVAAIRTILPGLPDEKTQMRFTGASGDIALREGYGFYRLVKQLVDVHRPDGFESCRDVMEMGCGWGRILRFFLKDLEGEQLLGIDCLPHVIDTARAGNRWARFDLVDAYPPTGLGADSFDLVYCYSVFSHLSEDAHRHWLGEFHRLLRPGGLLIATTRRREFFEACRRRREEKAGGAKVKDSGASRAFVATEEWKARYDRGDFCHDAVGGGDGLPDDFFGETAIPLSYVEREWPRHGLTVRSYVSDPRLCPQNVIVAQKE